MFYFLPMKKNPIGNSDRLCGTPKKKKTRMLRIKSTHARKHFSRLVIVLYVTAFWTVGICCDSVYARQLERNSVGKISLSLFQLKIRSCVQGIIQVFFVLAPVDEMSGRAEKVRRPSVSPAHTIGKSYHNYCFRIDRMIIRSLVKNF